ncbi:Ig-like domain-containing protein [Actinocorallia longicatena]|uniref:Ig-like domain-containing protein n=1 Tax=Actinocorallia longicatena TaxID=111803 RepID=A0ABP6QDE1_9ACTN
MGDRRAALALAGLLAVAGCQSGGGDGGKDDGKGAALSVVPADGAGDVRPDQPVVVTADGEKITEVAVTADGEKAEGDLSADAKSWRTRWTLAPGTRYQVVARTEKGTSVTSAFTTLKPAKTIGTSIVGPEDGGTAGVGMPIILNFNTPVYNQDEVLKALDLKMSEQVEGAWRWVSRQQLVYRPRAYWPSGQKIKLVAHLKGVRAAKDTYGTRDLSYGFTVGDAVVSTVDTRTHTMTVRRNGKIVRKIPISAGRATKRAYTTTNGIHLTMERAERVVADSATVGIPKGDPEYYRLDLKWAVRISNSGEYVHAAPWSVGSQGNANVSHGCVNASDADARWFYDQSVPGNIVIVTGTDRELEWNNGWGFWQVPWAEWSADSAMEQPAGVPSTPAPATG